MGWPRSHQISFSHSRCMCPAENPGCRDQPFTILYRDMDVVSTRSVPADIFQMQATTRYPGAYYIFQIKSGNEGREFYMRVRNRGGESGTSWDPLQGGQEWRENWGNMVEEGIWCPNFWIPLLSGWPWENCFSVGIRPSPEPKDLMTSGMWV